ncbi:HAD-IB family phosphatase [Porticoccaceae bacterium]|nr:HAD-IB family phosphatase [Porticoccaceae bacterium]
MKLIIFDFCETLTVCQTSNRYLLAILKNNGFMKYYFCSYLLMSKAIKKYHRNILMFFIKGCKFDRAIAKTYHSDLMTDKLNKKTVKLLSEYGADESCQTMILSAGFEEYINFFSNELKVDHTIACSLEQKLGHYTGSYTSSSCHGSYKLIELLSFLKSSCQHFEEVIFYTDCLSDLPCILFADKSYLVKENSISLLDVNSLKISEHPM